MFQMEEILTLSSIKIERVQVNTLQGIMLFLNTRATSRWKKTFHRCIVSPSPTNFHSIIHVVIFPENKEIVK